MTISATPPSLIDGLRPPDRSFERCWVRPGAATAVPLHAGDRVTVTRSRRRPAGRAHRAAPNVARSASGRSGHGAAGLWATAAFLRVGAFETASGRTRPGRCACSGPTPRRARAEAFAAERGRAAGGRPRPAGRLVDGDPPASALVVEISARGAARAGRGRRCRRRWPSRGSTSASTAPAPLAYEVKDGEYIQIIDVQGRQCSDFLAFHRRKLEHGLERGLDATDTRTLMGNAYPQPGLHGEVLRPGHGPARARWCATPSAATTPSRWPAHAKYYEDMGYPGHVNCTDNFNGALEPVRRSPRARAGRRSTSSTTPGFDGDNMLVSDEPWSRPGDYVLLRAMTDLVCASSACPDDIDPANGWECDRHPRARLLAREPVLDGHRPSRDPGRRAGAHQARRRSTRAPSELTRELRRVPRLLAAALLQQRGRDRRVLGVPREGGGDGPLAAAQVGGARPGRRGAAAGTPSPATSASWPSARSSTRRSATRPAG